jgi:hypothetical protein
MKMSGFVCEAALSRAQMCCKHKWGLMSVQTAPCVMNCAAVNVQLCC